MRGTSSKRDLLERSQVCDADSLKLFRLADGVLKIFSYSENIKLAGVLCAEKGLPRRIYLNGQCWQVRNIHSALSSGANGP